jgi:ATP phosphoribosyltransferase regulatory subunit
MQMTRKILPWGKYYLPSEAEKRRNIERTIGEYLSSKGYQEIIPPTIVNAETGLSEADQVLREKGIRMIGRRGDLLALRTDFTVPIASLAAAYLVKNKLPLRLYYTGNVFRVAPKTGEIDEFYQAGIELIGLSGPSADSEVIMLALEALISTGLNDFQIGVGYAGILQGILDSAGAMNLERESVTLALSQRNYVDYRDIVNRSNWPTRCKEALLSLPFLHGNVDILDTLPDAVIGEKGSLAVQSLRAVFSEIEKVGLKHKVYVDLGMTRTFGYYTGTVFEGYVPGVGQAVVGGGRYDRLFSSFGVDLPAIGFAVDVDRVISVL